MHQNFYPLKIFNTYCCLERIFPDNEKEFDIPFLIKAETSILKTGTPFYYPPFSNDIVYELGIVLKVNRLGKYIEERFATRYFELIAPAVSFIANDLKNKSIIEGTPWGSAFCFDNSIAIGNYQNLNPNIETNEVKTINIKLGNQNVFSSSNIDLTNRIKIVISYLSKFSIFHIGDLVYLPLINQYNPVCIGQIIEVEMNGKETMRVNVC